MSEIKKVLNEFEKDIALHVEFIEEAINKGNKKEALDWFNELLNMKQVWLNIYQQPALVIQQGSFGKGIKEIVDLGFAKKLASMRTAIANNAIKESEKLLKKAGILV